MKLVFATTDAIVTLPSGVGVTVHRGEHWPASDPIVRDHPHLFDDDPMVGLRATVAPEDSDVEQATKAPGEKRQTTRRRDS